MSAEYAPAVEMAMDGDGRVAAETFESAETDRDQADHDAGSTRCHHGVVVAEHGFRLHP